MPRITIEVSESTLASLKSLAKLCTETDQERSGATTHGALRVPALLAMLAEDAAMVIDRPGSWEGAGMEEVLSRHGYQF